LFSYIKNIPLPTLESYFKKTEVTAELFSGILKTINEKGLTSDEETKWSGNFLKSLSKADKFEMTVMFAEDQDRKSVTQIIEKLSPVDASLAKEIEKAYTEE